MSKATAGLPAMTETELQNNILELCKWLGIYAYHPYDSRRSEKGWPDLAMITLRKPRLIFAELKSAKGRVTTKQCEVITRLREAGQEVHVWRPADWHTGLIGKVLRG